MRTRLLLALCILCLLLPVAAFAQSIDDYTIFSNNSLTLRDRAKIKNGLLGSNTGMQMGYDSAITGNIRSRGNLTMLDRSTITGNATLGGKLNPGAQTKVTGTLTQYASVPAFTLPSTSNPDYTYVVDLTVPSGTTKVLQTFGMDFYRNVVVSSNATLVLGRGNYYIGTLTVQPDATIIMGLDRGGVDVWVVKELKISDRCRILAAPLSLDATDAKIYSDQTAALAIGTDGRIEASLILSRAAVTLGDRTTLLGKLYAKTVTIGYDCQVNGATGLDSDGDGMPNGWETSNGLNPNVNDANNDPDGDGLKNIDEFGWGTKPKVADTDGDGINDGAENTYWAGHSGGIGSGSDPDNDGLINILDPDSDNDGVLDGAELTGWTIVVQGVTKTYVGDPANPDSDYDGVPDGKEKDGYATDFPNHIIDHVEIAVDGDTDEDGIDNDTEKMFGLNPFDPQTIGFLGDRKYFQMVNHMGEWAVSPTTGHLNPQLASTATCILEANVGFGDDTATDLSMDRQMEFSLFLPQDGQPVTLKLDFVYDSGVTPDPSDRFYDIKYSGAVYPEGTDGAPAINYPGTDGNSITWRITDPLYYLKGDYFVNFSYHYDKNNGEKPRQIRLYAYYDDNTRARIQYVTPVKAGTYRSPMHFSLLVSGGSQPAYFRGETAVSSASSSYIDNIVLKDYYGNLVRNIGKKAFNGYWFQYPLGKLNVYPGGVSGLTSCQRLEFDWVHDAATDKHHNIFTIDEVGNKWDDVQITYNRAYQTQDYYCWYGGVSRNIAVVRRGNAIQVEATNGSLQFADAQVTIKNRAGMDVTSTFTIHKESGYADYAAYDGANPTWRENWIVEAPTTAPVGMYTITMKAGAWTASTSFYLVFNRTEMSIGDAEYAGYGYDEDTDGLALDGDNDAGIDLINSYLFGDSPYVTLENPFSKIVTDLTVAAIDGKTGLFTARDAIRLFTSKLIDGINSGTDNKRVFFSVEVCLRYSGVTVAEAFAGTIDDSHRLWGDCAANASISTMLARAAGIPGKIVSGWGAACQPNYDPDPVTGKTTPSANGWGKHAWSEAWVENPAPPVTDHWYVYDSLSYMGSTYGISCSRVYYGSVWMVPVPSMVLVPSAADPGLMLDVEASYKP
jgi:hypothetical protein